VDGRGNAMATRTAISMKSGYLLTRLVKRLTGRQSSNEQLTTYKERYRIAAVLSAAPLSLPRILQMFGSDKQRSGQHSYGSTYERLFRPKRYRPIKLMEIGLLGGASLLAWRCYFPFGTTIGIDIEDKPHLAGPRTRVYQADQSSAAELADICRREGPFDIIIDDGSHLSRHQSFTFYEIFDSLKEGGVYVIEDVQTSFWSPLSVTSGWDGRHIDDPDFQRTCYGEFLELAKYLNHAEFMSTDGIDQKHLSMGKKIRQIAFEHNLILILKGKNEQPSNRHA
jgi:hypothetical protein